MALYVNGKKVAGIGLPGKSAYQYADETKQLIQPVPAIASQAAYLTAGILCTGQAANNLTFTCQTVPEADLTVYVVITDVKS